MRDTAPPSVDDDVARAAEAIVSAEHLLIGAGAGMGVDSGLPDFRGPQGFWRAYPAFEKLGLRFEQIANARWFDEDPHLAWGFYGHRLNLDRATRPHAGFEILLTWARRCAGAGGGHYVFTSNVDGQFQLAGFEDARIVECHGSIHHVQCAARCSEDVWRCDAQVKFDESTMRAADPLPTCPRCGGVARPNVLMFGFDNRWIAQRSEEQLEGYLRWVQELEGADGGGRLAIVECGAGTAVPSVRENCEFVARQTGATLIRINPREPEVPAGAGAGGGRHVALAMSSLDALRVINRIVAP